VDTIVTRCQEQTTYALSVAGPISFDNRVVRKYTNVLPDDFDIPLSEMVEEGVRARTGKEVRVFVIKDAVASGMAEMGPAGAAPDRDEVLALILGTGTGGAPCRRLPSGEITFPDALADLGHHQVDPLYTEPCNCGGSGCVERQTSGSAILRKANLFSMNPLSAAGYRASGLFTERGIMPGAITGEDFSWGVAVGDGFVLDILREAARPLAVLLRNVFTSHPNMTVVLVGGFALGVGSTLADFLRTELTATGIPFVPRQGLARFVETRVLVGAIPADATNLVGARMFLLQRERGFG
jgi:predicted NBD/HSP70 family sugar kinase